MRDTLPRTLLCGTAAVFAWHVAAAGDGTNMAADFELVSIAAGTAQLGDAEGEANEAVRSREIAAFRLMRYEVTNSEFARFVAETGHVTDAERRGSGYVWTGAWLQVAGAQWRRPFGPESSIADSDAHPVLQTSANDAAAFCSHYGMRLPAESEWEYAARGEEGRRYPWGSAAPREGGVQRANFGTVSCCSADASDGYRQTAPVGSYRQGLSPFGLHDMAGNVWEWTSSPFPGDATRRVLKGGGWGNNPYCLRAAYKHGNAPDIGLDMVGFRCAADLP